MRTPPLKPAHSALLVVFVAAASVLAACDRADTSRASGIGAPSADVSTLVLDTTPLARTRSAAADERMDGRRALLMDMRQNPGARTPEPDDDTTSAAIAAAGPGAKIVADVEGDFSAPGANEHALLVESATGETWLVFAGSSVRKARASEASMLLSSPDTNGDGRNEILLRRTHDEDDRVRSDLVLLTVQNGRLATVAEFADARVDACAADQPGVHGERIEYAAPEPGAWPEFVIVASDSDCVDGRAPDLNGFIRRQRAAD